MGYRLRIGKISKVAHLKYKDLQTEEEVKKTAGLKETDSIYYSLPEYKELYEIGKYVDYSKGTTPFFKFELDDVEFSVASKEWFLELIEIYRIKTEKWYELLSKALIKKKSLEDDVLFINGNIDKESGLFPIVELFRHINERLQLWTGKYLLPYELEKEKGLVSGRWDYEYSVFDLIHILHTFDWENDLMIYSGW